MSAVDDSRRPSVRIWILWLVGPFRAEASKRGFALLLEAGLSDQVQAGF
jgi:hypothetical protein